MVARSQAQSPPTVILSGGGPPLAAGVEGSAVLEPARKWVPHPFACFWRKGGKRQPRPGEVARCKTNPRPARGEPAGRNKISPGRKLWLGDDKQSESRRDGREKQVPRLGRRGDLARDDKDRRSLGAPEGAPLQTRTLVLKLETRSEGRRVR